MKQTAGLPFGKIMVRDNVSALSESVACRFTQFLQSKVHVAIAALQQVQQAKVNPPPLLLSH